MLPTNTYRDRKYFLNTPFESFEFKTLKHLIPWGHTKHLLLSLNWKHFEKIYCWRCILKIVNQKKICKPNVRDAIKLAYLTLGKSVFPMLEQAERELVPTLTVDHDEHFIPKCAKNPSGSPRSSATMANLSWSKTEQKNIQSHPNRTQLNLGFPWWYLIPC